MEQRQKPFSGIEEEKLWAMWNRVREGEYDLRHMGQWEMYEGFMAWMFGQGWRVESMVMRRNPKAPKTPDNCYITTKGTSSRLENAEWQQQFIQRWAKAVNPFRKAAGLEPL